MNAFSTDNHCTAASSYHCALIGEGNLTLACAKILEQSALIIDIIITSHKKLIAWCSENNIPFAKSTDDYYQQLKAENFDYLICVINENKLHQKIIELAKICSINYHDSLLPHYAGVHATAWAVLNGENFHGITWHAMNDRIDGGDLLLNKQFSVRPNETSFSLNIKCFETAISSLPELIKKLLHPPLTLNSQQPLPKNFFYKADKPKNNGVITADMTLTTISRLINAADFGHIANDFYSVKIKIGQNFYILLQAQCVFDNHNVIPGSITEITPESIIFAFAEGYLNINKVANFKNMLDLNEVIKLEKIHLGYSLASGDQPQLKEYKKISQKHYADEMFLIKQIQLQRLANIGITANTHEPANRQYLVHHSSNLTLTNSKFVAVFCRFIAEHMQQPSVIVPIQNRTTSFKVEYQDFFLAYSFICADISKSTTLDELNKSTQLQLSQLPLIQSDIKWRYPKLNSDFIFPQLLISLEHIPCKQSAIIFHYYQEQLELLLSEHIMIDVNLIDAINSFLLLLQQHETENHIL